MGSMFNGHTPPMAERKVSMIKSRDRASLVSYSRHGHDLEGCKSLLLCSGNFYLESVYQIKYPQKNQFESKATTEGGPIVESWPAKIRNRCKCVDSRLGQISAEAGYLKTGRQMRQRIARITLVTILEKKRSANNERKMGNTSRDLVLMVADQRSIPWTTRSSFAIALHRLQHLRSSSDRYRFRSKGVLELGPGSFLMSSQALLRLC